MISKLAATQLFSVLTRFVSRERVPELLVALRSEVAGNQSYRDTIADVAHLFIDEEFAADRLPGSTPMTSDWAAVEFLASKSTDGT